MNLYNKTKTKPRTIVIRDLPHLEPLAVDLGSEQQIPKLQGDVVELRGEMLAVAAPWGKEIRIRTMPLPQYCRPHMGEGGGCPTPSVQKPIPSPRTENQGP